MAPNDKKIGEDAETQVAARHTAGASPDAPRWSQIAADLARTIDAGDIAEGAVLPAASVMAARYGVNRHTARQAYRHLQELGLVNVERGRGTTVTGRRFPYRIGRRVSFRTNFGSAGIAAAGEILDCGLGSPPAEIADLLAIPAETDAWTIRLVSRAAGTPVSTGPHWLSAARFPDFARRLAESHASVSATFTTYGIRDYVRLSTRLTARLATPLEADILGLAPDAPVMQSFGVDGLADGTPLQVVCTAFAADRVEFVIAPELQ